MTALDMHSHIRLQLLLERNGYARHVYSLRLAIHKDVSLLAKAHYGLLSLLSGTARPI